MTKTARAFSLMVFLVPVVARAEEPNEPPKEETKEEKSEPRAHQRKHHAHEEAEERFGVIADIVGGGATMPVLSEGAPKMEPPANVFDSTRVTATSLVLALELHATHTLHFGARMPFIVGSLASRTGASADRSLATQGNVEVEAAYEFFKRRHFEMDARLEVALPTADGGEMPTEDEVARERDKRYSYGSYDRFAVARAASFTRGAFDSALFEPGRFGVIPRVNARLVYGGFSASLTVKAENLIDVTGKATEPAIVELVTGLRLAYRAFTHVEPSVHVWVTSVLTKTAEPDPHVVIEPGLRFLWGPVTPSFGVILPAFGPMITANAWGLRAQVAVGF